MEATDNPGPEIQNLPSPSGGLAGSSHAFSRADSAEEASSGYRARPAALPPFPHTPDFLLDVQINVSVEVGRIAMSVREVMDLGPGAVIELQHSASEPVEIHANGRCIGRGEIVVVGEQFGVRITELGPS
jgi:flagellar motor switch protein FliN